MEAAIAPAPSPEMSPAERKYLGCTQLTITTPTNLTYSGQVFGVKFHDGRALVNRETPNRWGYTLEQIGAKFDVDLGGNGYVVKPAWAIGPVQEFSPTPPAPADPEPAPTLKPKTAKATRRKLTED